MSNNLIKTNWYDNLKKPSFSPPNYLFGIVWPVLYTLMGLSFYLVWTNKNCFPYCEPLIYFGIQLFFNLIWTSIFFKYKKPKLALLDIILIIVFTIITYTKFNKIDKIASYLLIPYILWLFFAFFLNLYIVLNN